jgi:hypothetical protein
MGSNISYPKMFLILMILNSDLDYLKFGQNPKKKFLVRKSTRKIVNKVILMWFP